MHYKVSGQLQALTDLPPGKEPPVRDWVDLRVDLDAVEKRKTPSHRRESNPRTPLVQLVAQLLYQLSYPSSFDSMNLCTVI
jgi:hypothetical protein